MRWTSCHSSGNAQDRQEHRVYKLAAYRGHSATSTTCQHVLANEDKAYKVSRTSERRPSEAKPSSATQHRVRLALVVYIDPVQNHIPVRVDVVTSTPVVSKSGLTSRDSAICCDKHTVPGLGWAQERTAL